jgi:hypothetical protein
MSEHLLVRLDIGAVRNVTAHRWVCSCGGVGSLTPGDYQGNSEQRAAHGHKCHAGAMRGWAKRRSRSRRPTVSYMPSPCQAIEEHW